MSGWDLGGAERQRRPDLTSELTEVEFLRWYWLRSELATFARAHSISTAGGKSDVADRIADLLAGRLPRTPAPRPTPQAQLTGPLSEDTVLPVGQKSSQLLREWFVAQVGTSFRFDATMRAFLARGGATLGEAVEHWRNTRGVGPLPIDDQFELNRFTRTWHAEHAQGTRAELLAAWQEYRALPNDARPMA